MDNTNKALSVYSILAEAWRSVKSIELTVYKRLGLMFLVMMPFVLLNVIIFYLSGPKSLAVFGSSSPLVHGIWIINTVACVVGSMVIIPLLIACVRHSINLSLDMQVINKDCKLVNMELLKLCVGYTLIANISFELILINIESTLFSVLVSTVLLAFIYSLKILIFVFSAPLVVLRRIGAVHSISICIKKVNPFLVTIISCYLILLLMYLAVFFLSLLMMLAAFFKYHSILLAVLSVILFITPLLWLIPWSYVTGGILFREVFQMKMAPSKATNPVSRSMIITILILVGLIVPVSAAVIPIFKFGQVFSAKVLQGDGMKSQQMMMEINRIIYLISEFTYNYREKNGTYSGISSEELAKLMPTKTLTTPWGSTILIGNISQDSYTVTLNDTPMDVCKYLLSSMTNNPMQHSDSQCNDDWSNDFTYTFTYMTRDQMYKYNMEQSRLHQR